MKILIVNNAAMALKNNRLFTNNLNGIFIDELKQNNDLYYFQFANKDDNNISVYDLEKNGVKCIPVKNYKNKIFKYIIAYIKLFFQIHKYDFVYFYYPTTFKFATFFCLLFNKNYGLYIRGMFGLKDKISHFIYRKAFTVFTVSDFFTDYVNKINKNNIANTIRPMIPYTNKDVVLYREYAEKDKYNILFLGRIEKDKGLNELITAINILKQEGVNNFKFTIVGNGSFLEELEQTSKQLNIDNLISFEGPVFDDEKKKEFFLNADLYILPTYHEGFPRTLYEAMIFGTPIITTFVGGIPALMKDKYNCIEIKPMSVESIVEALKYSMTNYDVMGELAKKATTTVTNIVDPNRLSHAQHLNKILNETL